MHSCTHTHTHSYMHSHAPVRIHPHSAMIEALQAENADLMKNLSLAGSRQNEQKVRKITRKYFCLSCKALKEKLRHFKQCKDACAQPLPGDCCVKFPLEVCILSYLLRFIMVDILHVPTYIHVIIEASAAVKIVNNVSVHTGPAGHCQV